MGGYCLEIITNSMCLEYKIKCMDSGFFPATIMSY